MQEELAAIKDFAVETALAAGELIRTERENQSFDTQYKAQQELVTSADLAADKLIIEGIRSRFPTHRILSEETCNDKSLAKDLDQPIWIIDPIDGTVNYAHGQMMVAVSIAYACAGEVKVGVVHNPFMDETFIATADEPSTLNGRAISVSGHKNLGTALVATGFPYNKETVPEILKRVETVLMHCQDIRRLGSAALDICWVACGRLDAYFESLSPWDFAAARLIAMQAGASCGNFCDVPEDIPACIYPHHLLISSPELYQPLQTLLRPNV